jgi:anti-sigma B factor antagonist
MSDMFSVSSERIGDDGAVVTLTGEVDIHTAPRFKECLLGAIDDGARNLVVDLSEVTFIDSMALGALIGGVRRVHDLDGSITVVVATQPVERILSITGLDRVLSLHATREEALTAIS